MRRPSRRDRRRPCPLGPGETLEPRLALAVVVVSPLPDLTVPAAATSQTISLSGRFDDTAVTGTLVRFTTNSPAPDDRIFVELFDQPGAGRTRTTPQTVANFLAYADEGRYANTIIHRRVTGFVTQGGGFSAPTAPYGGPGGAPTVIATKPPVVNEPGNTNIRGTIAMAKLGNNPDSATNQWFFNLADNSSNLDNQNGGFTAFGRVLGAGKTLIDVLSGITVVDADGGKVFSDLPLQGLKSGQKTLNPGNYLAVSRAERSDEVTYKVNAAGAKASIGVDGQLQLSWTKAPSKPVTVTVEATSILDGETSLSSFQILPYIKPGATALMGTRLH